MKQLEVSLPTGQLSLSLAPGRIPIGRLIGFAARQNPKRPFLFVSKVLGKHYPVRPAMMAWSYRKLAREVLAKNPHPDALWVGMAETATGLGYGVFEAATKPSPEGEGWVRGNQNKEQSLFKSPHPGLLPEGEGVKSTALPLYLQTTRYHLSGHDYLTFEESHSHATDFWLYYPEDPLLRRRFMTARELVLIDDEISTGRTFTRLIQAYRRINPALARVFIVSLVNFADPEARAQVAAQTGLPVEWIALRHGSLTFTGDTRFEMPPMPNVTAAEQTCKKTLLSWPGRLGLTAPPAFSPQDIDALAASFKPPGSRLKPILVAGTGECIAPAYLLGRALEKRGFDVRVQSTTRSPIMKGGAIRSIMTMTDNYGDGIMNFLYNVAAEEYRDVIVCHETPLNSALCEWLAPINALSARVAFTEKEANYGTLSFRRLG